MKKLLITAIMLFAVVWTHQAQELHFGIKGGLNFATIGGDDTDGLDMRTSFHLGALMEIKLNEKFSIQPEALYSGQGTSGKEDGLDIELKLDYINIPIMAKYYFTESFNIEAGPQFGFMVSSKAESDGVEVDLDEFDLFKDFDLSLGVGAGYKFGPNFFVGARYNFGLSNIYDDSNFDDNSSNQNMVLQISAGYMF